MEDLSWVATTCKEAATSPNQVTYDDGWHPVTADDVTLILPPLQGRYLSADYQINRHYEGTLYKETTTAALLFDLSIGVTLRVAFSSGEGSYLFRLTKAVKGLPEAAPAGYIPWSGRVESSSSSPSSSFASGPNLMDVDLFDGALPAWLQPPSSSISANDSSIAILVTLFASLVDIMGPMEATPSSVVATSRGMFLPPSLLLPLQEGVNTFEGRMTVRQISSSSASKKKFFEGGKKRSEDGEVDGILLQLSAGCGLVGDSKCVDEDGRDVLLAQSLLEAAQELVEGSLVQGGYSCRSGLQLVEATYMANLTADFFLSDTTVTLRAIHGTAYGCYHCLDGSLGEDSYIGFQVDVRGAAPNNSYAWPLRALSDLTTALSLVKSVALTSSGSIYGVLRSPKGAIIASTLPHLDLFAAVPSGVLQPDVGIGADAPDIQGVCLRVASSLFTAIPSLLAAEGMPVLNEILAGFFDPSMLPSIVGKYVAITSAPTCLGFLHYALQHVRTNSTSTQRALLDLHLLVGPGSQNATLYITLVAGTAAVTDSPMRLLPLDGANNLLQKLGAGVKAAYPSLANYEVPILNRSTDPNHVRIDHQHFTALLSAGVAIESLLAAITPSNTNSASQLSVSLLWGPEVQARVELGVSLLGETDATSAFLFSSVNMTYMCLAASEEPAGWIFGRLPTPTSDGVGVVSLTAQGGLDTNDDFNPSNGLAQGFDVVSRNLSGISWANTALQPLDIKAVDVRGQQDTTSVAMADLLNATRDAMISYNPANLSWSGVVQAMQSSLTAFETSVPGVIFAMIGTRPTNDSLEISISVTQHTRSAIQPRADWQYVADTSRVHMPLHLRTDLRMIVLPQNQSSQVLSITLRGGGQYSGWRLPFLYGMWAGSVVNGNASAQINLPDAASNLFVDFGAIETPRKMTNGSTTSSLPWPITASITAPLAAKTSQPAQVSVTAPSNWVISPVIVKAAIADSVLNILPNSIKGGLNVQLPPFEGVLSDLLPDVNVTIASLKPRLTTSMYKGGATPSLISSKGFKLSDLQKASSTSLSITINGLPPVVCSMPQLDSTTIDTLVTGVTSYLSGCGGLGTYLQVEYFQQGQGTDLTSPTSRRRAAGGDSADDPTYSLTLNPTIWGIIRSLNVSSQLDSAIVFNGAWADKGLPGFGSWQDLAWLFARAISKRVPCGYTRPMWRDLVVDGPDGSSLVPSHLRPVYPSQLPSISIALNIDHLRVLKQSLTAPLTADDSLSMTWQSSTAEGPVLTSMDTQFVAVFAGPVRDKNITFSTSFDGQSLSVTSPVPPAPRNTFTLQLTAERRSPTTQVSVPLSVTQLVTLTPGTPMASAMLDVVTQIAAVAPWAASMLTVFRQPPPLKGSAEQIRIRFGRREDSTVPGGWLLPTSMAIQNSFIPGIKNATNVPQQVQLAVGNTQLSVVAPHISVQGSQGNGTLGIAGLQAASLSGSGNASFIATPILPWITLPAVPSVLVNKANYNNFTVTVSIDSALNITGVKTTDVSSSSLTAPDIVLTMAVPGLQVSMGNLSTQMKKQYDDWQIGFVTPAKTKRAAIGQDAFQWLSKLDSNSFCNWMGLIENASFWIIDNPLTQPLLPFSQESLSSIWNSHVAVTLRDIANDMCRSDQTYSLADFCDVLNSRFQGIDTDICAKATLQGDKLVLGLAIVQIINLNSVLYLDTPRLFGDPNLPAAQGGGGDLSLLVNATLEVDLEVTFNTTSGMRFGLGVDTKFTLGLTGAASGDLDFYFAHFQVAATALDAWLGEPVATMTLKFTPAGDLQLSVNGSTGLKVFLTLGSDLCGLEISVDDLSAFLKSNASVKSVVVKQSGCQGNFPEALIEEIISMTPFSYFLGNGVLRQLKQGFDALLDDLQANSAVPGPLDIPLVGQAFHEVLSLAFSAFSSPFFVQQWTAEIMTLSTQPFNTTMGDFEREVEQLLLNGVTKALCEALQPILYACPPPPRAAPSNVNGNYSWPLRLGQQRQLSSEKFAFDLGDHGVAALAMTNCGETITAGWGLNVTLVYSQSTGIQLRPAEIDPFAVHLDLLFSEGCALEGILGLLGVEILMADSSGIHAELTVGSRRTRDIYAGHALARWNEGRDDTSSFRSLSFVPSFLLNALLAGEAEVGFAGTLAEALAGATDSMQMLPHYKADLEVQWNYSSASGEHGRSALHAPIVSLNNATLCLGRVLMNMIKGVLDTITPITNDLGVLAGVDGILRQQVGATAFIFGHPLTVIELLAELANVICDGGCEFEGAYELLAWFDGLTEIFDIIQDLEKSGVDGCDVGQVLSEGRMWMNMNETDVKMHFQGHPPPDGTITYNKTLSEANRKKFVNGWTTFANSSQLGVTFPLLKDPAQRLVDVLLGRPFAIVAMTLPKVVISIGKTWQIPVWDLPEVILSFHFEAGFSVDIGEVALLSTGIERLVSSRSATAMLAAVAIPATNDDGTMRWPCQAWLTLGGGVIVSFIIELEADAQISLSIAMRWKDVNHDGWVTFDEIARMADATCPTLVVRIQLTAGFSIRVSLCLRFCFFECFAVCFTLLEEGITFPVWGQTWGDTMPEQVVGVDGSISLDSLAAVSSCGSSKRQLLLGASTTATTATSPACISVYNSQGHLTVDTWPAGSDRQSVAASRTFTAMPSSISVDGRVEGLNLVVKNVTIPVYLPPSPQAYLNISQQSYSQAKTFSVTPTRVGPDYVPGVGITPTAGCGGIFLTDPLPGAKVNILGLPCSLLVQSASTNTITVSGDRSQFLGQPIQIQGNAKHLNYQVQGSSYAIGEGSITVFGDNVKTATPTRSSTSSSSVNYTPGAISGVSVRGNLPATQFTINSAQEYLSIVATGINNVFQVSDISKVNLVNISGGPGEDFAQFVFKVPAADPGVAPTTPQLVATVGMTIVQTVPVKSVVTMQRVNRIAALFEGQPNTRCDVVMSPGQQGERLAVQYTGGGDANVNVTSCVPDNDYPITLNGTGEHNVWIGSGNKLSDLLCEVRVLGSPDPGAVDIINLLAGDETRNLLFDMSQGRLILSDLSEEGQPLFSLFYSDIERLIIHFSSSPTEVRLSAASKTEVLLAFPEATPNTTSSAAIVRIWETVNTILITGAVNTLSLGSHSSEVPPFTSINAMVAFAPSAATGLQPPTIVLNSALGPQAPQQYFLLDSMCLNPVNSTHQVPPIDTLAQPTPWMCGLLQAQGFPSASSTCQAYTSCHFLYTGGMSFNISTGDAADYFEARNISRANPVHARFAGGDDVVVLSEMKGDTQLELGNGDNRLNVTDQSGPLAASLGSGQDSVLLTSTTGTPPTDGVMAVVLLGDGNNTFTLWQPQIDAMVVMGEGNDTGVIYQPQRNITCTLGDGDNTLNITDITLASVLVNTTSGTGRDTFTLTRVSGSVVVDSGGGDDVVLADHPQGPLRVSLNEGRDNFTLLAPIAGGPIALGLGEDADVDIVDTYYGDLFPPPSMFDQGGLVIKPLGPSPSSLMLLNQVYQEDQVRLLRGTLADVTSASSGLLITMLPGNSCVVECQVPTPNSVVVYDMADGCTYRVVALASDATLILDSRGSPMVIGWQLDVVLPNIDNGGIIEVLANSGTPGIVNLTLPSTHNVTDLWLHDYGTPSTATRRDNNYKTHNTQRDGCSGGVVAAGGLLVRLQCVDHVLVSSAGDKVDLVVEGSPNGADVVAVLSTQSTVNIQSLDANILVVGGAVNMPTEVTTHAHDSGALVAILHSPFATVSTPATTEHSVVAYDSGCLHFPSLSPPQPQVWSRWFSSQMDAWKVSSDLRERQCTLYTNAVDSLTLTTAHRVHISGLTQQAVLLNLMEDSQVTLNDTFGTPEAWTYISLSDDCLYTYNTNTNTSSWRLCVLPSPVVAPSVNVSVLLPAGYSNTTPSHFALECPKEPTPQAQWMIGYPQQGSASQLAWSGKSCNGVLIGSGARGLLPALLEMRYVEPDMNVTLALYGLDPKNDRDIIVTSDGGFTWFADFSNHTANSSDWQGKLFYRQDQVLLRGERSLRISGNSSNRISVPEPLSNSSNMAISLARGAEVLIPISNNLQGFYLVGSSPQFHAVDHTVSPSGDKESTYFLLPSSQCTIQSWVDISVYGGTPCPASSSGYSRSLVTLATETPFQCESDLIVTPGYDAPVTQNSSTADYSVIVPTDTKGFLWVAYLFSGTAQVVLWAQRRALSTGWVFILLTAAVAAPLSESYDGERMIELRSLGLQAYDLVFNFFGSFPHAGSSCGESSRHSHSSVERHLQLVLLGWLLFGGVFMMLFPTSNAAEEESNNNNKSSKKWRWKWKYCAYIASKHWKLLWGVTVCFMLPPLLVHVESWMYVIIFLTVLVFQGVDTMWSRRGMPRQGHSQEKEGEGEEEGGNDGEKESESDRSTFPSRESTQERPFSGEEEHDNLLPSSSVSEFESEGPPKPKSRAMRGWQERWGQVYIFYVIVIVVSTVLRFTDLSPWLALFILLLHWGLSAFFNIYRWLLGERLRRERILEDEGARPTNANVLPLWLMVLLSLLCSPALTVVLLSVLCAMFSLDVDGWLKALYALWSFDFISCLFPLADFFEGLYRRYWKPNYPGDSTRGPGQLLPPQLSGHVEVEVREGYYNYRLIEEDSDGDSVTVAVYRPGRRVLQHSTNHIPHM